MALRRCSKMKTVWTGNYLELFFDCGKTVILNIEETKEFEAWVFKKHLEFKEVQ